MPCTWSTSANILRRSIYPYSKPIKNWHGPFERRFTTQFFRSTASTISYGTRIGQPFVPSVVYSTTPTLANESTIETEHPAKPLTAVEMSRAAAQAVRLSISNQELRNAYFIVNSLRLSVLRENSSVAKIPGLRSQIQRFDPIHFEKSVSPRLSAHALLHGLIRLGLTAKASKQAELMMQDGMRIRSVSLQAAVHALLTGSPSLATTNSQSQLDIKVDGADILHLRPSMLSDPCTRHAIRLFLRAREYRQRRSKNTYQSLINACLLQGEIIIGSLLFVMVVKDWQLRKTLTARFDPQCRDPELPAECVGQSEVDLRARLNHLLSEDIVPQGQTMYTILSSINRSLSQDPQGESDHETFHASLQALANLAALLDSRQIPFPQIAPLIRALYQCPRVDHHVWIYRDGVPCTVKAYPYFHDVWRRLTGSLPSKPLSLSLQQNGAMLPPLDLHAYNALLHYTLRHRHSPTLANNLIEHMRKRRWKPLEPDITTYNILLRSGTLLRRRGMIEQTLGELRRKLEGADGGTSAGSPVEKSADNQSAMHSKTLWFSKAPYRSEAKINGHSNDALVSSTASIKADSFTFSSYIAHLTSTGKPHVVAHVLFRVLPELAIIDHPSWGPLPDDERQRLRALSRRACIERAVAHGPYFFTSVLNALCKAGKTGLAERVWHLAKEAERVSWIPAFMPESGPWCLPVHAYTTMIQCYAAEARAGLRSRRVQRRSNLTTEDKSDWKPRSKRYIRGWAQFVVSRKKVARPDVSQSIIGRHMGMVLFRSMKSGARAVYKSLLSVKHLDKGQWRNVQIPSPDARFFNAALELSAGQGRMPVRRKRTSCAYWRRRLKVATMSYVRRGKLPKYWTPMLHDIAQEMVNAGYSVPPALRHLFVGRWIPGMSQVNERQRLERRPLSSPFSQRDPGILHLVPTVKTRGRPNIWRRRRRRYMISTKRTEPSHVAAVLG